MIQIMNIFNCCAFNIQTWDSVQGKFRPVNILFTHSRYVGTVSAGEIRDFRGAMQGRTDKGLFITTGKFSTSAIEEANRPGTTPIDLIDGDDLVEKLRELQLGVVPVNDYTIDEAWFLSI